MRSPDAPLHGWVDRFVSDLDAIGWWLLRRSPWLIAGLLILMSLFKSGLVVWNWFELSPFLLTEWSAPASAFQSNIALNAVGTLWAEVGLDPTSLWWQVSQVLLTLIAFGTIAVLVLRRSMAHSSYLALALVLSSGLAAVLWREIGRYDALFVIGVAVATLAVRQWLAWMGVVLAVLASPEQAVVSAILLVMLSVLPFFRAWLSAGMRLLLGSIASLIAVQVWFTVAGDPFKTRIGVLLQHVMGEPIEAASAYDTKQGFLQFTIEKAMVSFSAGPALVWSILGMSVLVILFIIIMQRNWWQGIYLVGITMIIPVIVSFVFGEDRTRDSALVTAAVIIAVAVTGSERLAQVVAKLPGDPNIWLVWIALVMSLVPMAFFYLEAEESWRWTKELLVSLNNGVPMPIDGSAR